MKKILYFLSVLFIFVLIVFCNINKEPLNSENDGIVNRKVVGFTDHGCQEEENVLSKPILDTRIYVNNYRFNQDTLTLQIHYSANCCPGFVVDIDVTDNVAEIAMADTLRGCLCICEYINDFSFLYGLEGEMRILFNWWDITHTQLVTEMDTTIIVTGQES